MSHSANCHISGFLVSGGCEPNTAMTQHGSTTLQLGYQQPSRERCACTQCYSDYIYITYNSICQLQKQAVLFVSVCKCLTYIGKVAHDMCTSLEKAVFKFITHTIHSNKRSTLQYIMVGKCISKWYFGISLIPFSSSTYSSLNIIKWSATISHK